RCASCHHQSKVPDTLIFNARCPSMKGTDSREGFAMKTGLGLLGLVVISTLGTAPPPAAGQGAQAQGSASVSAQTNAGQASGGTSASANASGQAGQENASLASGTTMNAALNTSVDSKKAKAGDSVTAHTTEAVKADGKTVIPKGSKLIGHVTQA